MNAADAPHAAHVAGGVAAVQLVLVVQVHGGGQRLSRAAAIRKGAGQGRFDNLPGQVSGAAAGL